MKNAISDNENRTVDNNKFTIAIPSFNRAEKLVANLKSIVDHLPSWVSLLIVDNASEPPVQFDGDLCSKLEKRRISYVIHRNQVNIGGGANILRCFEHVDTKWFLLCGDDDLINPSKLEELRQLAVSNEEVAFIKFSCKFHYYEKNIKANGVDALMNLSGNFGSLLFMSTYLFNRTLCMKHLRYGYLMNGAYAPHVEIALLAARENPFILSTVAGVQANEEEAAWSPIDVVLSLYYLTDSPITEKERVILTRKIYAAHNIWRELLDIVTLYLTQKTKNEARFLRSKAFRTHLFFGHGFKRIVALCLMLISPIVGQLGHRTLVYAYNKTTGRGYIRKFVTRHNGL